MSAPAPAPAEEVPGRPRLERHRWLREREHHYRCTRCGCVKINVLRPGRYPDDPPQWVATFERGGQRREGLTPPCPGREVGAARPADAPAAPVTLALDLPPPSLPVPAEVPTTTAPGPALRPVREFLPLLVAGPLDATAAAYRAWLAQPRAERGSCGYCRHCGLRTRHGVAVVMCGHPRVATGGAPVPISEARSGGRFVPGRDDDPGGRCGIGAALFEAHAHG